MKKEMENIIKKSEEIVKKGEEIVNEVYPKVKDATQDLKDSVVGLVEKGAQSAQSFFEKKDKIQDETKDFLVSKHEIVKGDVEKVFEPKSNKKNTGKVVAGVALASLAASAYAIYKAKKIKNDNLKSEYAEKLQRWAELDMTQFDTETGDFNEPITVVPKKVYKVGSNAKLGDSIVINISKPSEGFSFNPEDEGKPLADLDIKKKIMTKAAEVKEKIKEKIDETKLQSKLGSMEAKDKYVEIKDIAEEKLEDVKSKFDQEITPNIKETLKETKEKVEELKEEAKDKLDDLKSNDMAFEDIKKKLENLKDKVEDKVEDLTEDSKEAFEKLKDKVEDKVEDSKEAIEKLKDKVEDKTGDLGGDSKEAFEKLKDKVGDKVEDSKEAFEKIKDKVEDKIDDLKSNDMAIDEPDNIVDEPFGVEEIIDDLKEGKDTIVEKAKKAAESAKAKLKGNDEDKESQSLDEFEVTIHNKGDKDYVFSPMQIQLYDLRKRAVRIKAKHEEGTTLGPVTIKPGETYRGKLYIKKTVNKPEGLIFFKDLGLKESVVYFLNEGEPVVEPELILNEDYLYSDEKVLSDEEYKRL